MPKRVRRLDTEGCPRGLPGKLRNEARAGPGTCQMSKIMKTGVRKTHNAAVANCKTDSRLAGTEKEDRPLGGEKGGVCVNKSL